MRTCIEHAYAHFKNMFKIFSDGHQLKLMKDAGAVQQLIVVLFLVFNCKTCMTGSNCTLIYDVMPPSIEEYLPVDEILEQAPEVIVR